MPVCAVSPFQEFHPAYLKNNLTKRLQFSCLLVVTATCVTHPASHRRLGLNLSLLCTIRDLFCLCPSLRDGTCGTVGDLFSVSEAAISYCSTSCRTCSTACDCASAETGCCADRDGHAECE